MFWPNRATRTPTEPCVTDSDDDLYESLVNAQLAWEDGLYDSLGKVRRQPRRQ